MRTAWGRCMVLAVVLAGGAVTVAACASSTSAPATQHRAVASVSVEQPVGSPRPVPPSGIPRSGHAVPATPASGSKTVSYHGVTLTVPESWPVGGFLCDSPSVNAVLPYTGQAASCPATPTVPRRDAEPSNSPHSVPPAPPARFTLVRLAPASVPTSAAATSLATRTVSIDGHRARRGTGTLPEQPGQTARRVSVLVVPSADVVVTVSAPSEAAAAEILDTARVTSVGPHGCPAQLSTYRVTGNRAATTLLPAQPVSGVVCEYVGNLAGDGERWLVGSAALSATQLGDLARTLNLAAAGNGANTRPVDPQLVRQVPHVRYRLQLPGGQTRTLDWTTDVSPTTITDGQHTLTVNVPLAVAAPVAG